jgi:hypothetical protein
VGSVIAAWDEAPEPPPISDETRESRIGLAVCHGRTIPASPHSPTRDMDTHTDTHTPHHTPHSNSSTERHDERAVRLTADDEIGQPLSTPLRKQNLGSLAAVLQSPVQQDPSEPSYLSIYSACSPVQAVSTLQSPFLHDNTRVSTYPRHITPSSRRTPPGPSTPRPRLVVRQRPARLDAATVRKTVGPTRSAAILAPVTAQIYPICLTSCSHCRHLSCHWAFCLSVRLRRGTSVSDMIPSTTSIYSSHLGARLATACR